MTRSLRVLAIDDNAANLKLLHLVLTLEGLMVEKAEDAETALQMIDAVRPDVVLADIQLPGMSGIDFARTVRRNTSWNGIALIAVSAHATKGDERRALAAGYSALIRKPIDTRNVGAQIAAILSGSSPAKPAQEGAGK